MAAQPKLKPKLTRTDKLLNAVGWAMLLILWTIVLVNYNNTPDIVPIHFNSAGQADAFGDKSIILIVCAFASIIFLFLRTLNRYPHLFNYPVKITETNAIAHYTLATRMISAMNICMMVVFIIVAYAMQSVSKNSLGWLFAAIGLTVVPIIWYFVSVRKLK